MRMSILIVAMMISSDAGADNSANNNGGIQLYPIQTILIL
jgi:hypothetical protein